MKKLIIICILLFLSINLNASQKTISGYDEIDVEKLTSRIITYNRMNTLDKRILKIARDTAAICAKSLEDAIDKGIKSYEEIFSTLYFPVAPITTCPTYNTFYDDYTDKYITPIEDEALTKNKSIVFVVLVDKNGYLPSHNTKYSQNITGDLEKDLKNNRTKRIFNDLTGFLAAKNDKKFLLQSYYRDTGEVMADLSVPVFVKGRHFGALRIGYRRSK